MTPCRPPRRHQALRPGACADHPVGRYPGWWILPSPPSRDALHRQWLQGESWTRTSIHLPLRGQRWLDLPDGQSPSFPFNRAGRGMREHQRADVSTACQKDT